jgi:hypothetical protein
MYDLPANGIQLLTQALESALVMQAMMDAASNNGCSKQ